MACKTPLAALCALAFVTCGVWCCGTDSRPDATLATAEVNPFPTAEQLLDHVNALIARNPIDQDGLDALLYTENEVQRRLDRLGRSLRPFDEMLHKTHERFGAGLVPSLTVSPMAPLPPAMIVERTEGRVRAATRFGDGEPLDLYLVQIGDRWWISGYTLERLFDGRELNMQMIDLLEHSTDRVVWLARSFSERIDRGEFSTIEELRAAWAAHLLSP